MNNDLISREALKKAMDKKAFDLANGGMIFIESINHIIDNAPTVEITDYDTGYQDGLEDGLNDIRPQGEWIDEGQYAEGHSEHAYICKKCGYQIIANPNMIFENRYCKYCGADMRGEK